MEYLDYYDENGNFLGTDTRDNVHYNGYWHKTAHCFLYDNKGRMYWQIRKVEQKLYTTASGHVAAGETVGDAFKREVFEEVGIEVDINNLTKADIFFWSADTMKNGRLWQDRAFSNMYIGKISENSVFSFQEEEVSGMIRTSAQDTLDLFLGNLKEIQGESITNVNGKNVYKSVTIEYDDFLNHLKELEKPLRAVIDVVK